MVTISGDKFPKVTKILTSLLKEETFTILDNKYSVPREKFFPVLIVLVILSFVIICAHSYISMNSILNLFNNIGGTSSLFSFIYASVLWLLTVYISIRGFFCIVLTKLLSQYNLSKKENLNI